MRQLVANWWLIRKASIPQPLISFRRHICGASFLMKMPPTSFRMLPWKSEAKHNCRGRAFGTMQLFKQTMRLLIPCPPKNDSKLTPPSLEILHQRFRAVFIFGRMNGLVVLQNVEGPDSCMHGQWSLLFGGICQFFLALRSESMHKLV